LAGYRNAEEQLSYGSIFDFVTVTVTVRRKTDDQVVQSITRDGVMTKLYKPQQRDRKSDLPVVVDNEYHPTWQCMTMTNIVAAVNFVSLEDISGNSGDRAKYAVVVQKQMS